MRLSSFLINVKVSKHDAFAKVLSQLIVSSVLGFLYTQVN